MNKLSIGSDFPKISLETTEGKSLIIPQDIKQDILFYCLLEGHGDLNALFSWKGIESIEYFLIGSEQP